MTKALLDSLTKYNPNFTLTVKEKKTVKAKVESDGSVYVTTGFID